MEVVKDIAAIIGCILSLISLITLCTKNGRSLIKKLIVKNTQDIQTENAQQAQDIEALKQKVDIVLQKFDGLEEVSKQQCRDTIKTIYYKYYKDKRLPLYERKTADYTYDIYTRVFNGNSYASLLYTEICKWEIDTLSYQDLCEED